MKILSLILKLKELETLHGNIDVRIECEENNYLKVNEMDRFQFEIIDVREERNNIIILGDYY
jgi:hypothetical protein